MFIVLVLAVVAVFLYLGCLSRAFPQNKLE
jgi:hypothetical protein